MWTHLNVLAMRCVEQPQKSLPDRIENTFDILQYPNEQILRFVQTVSYFQTCVHVIY